MKNILLNLVRSFALVGALVVGGLGVVALQTQPVAAAPVSEVQDGVNAIGGKGQTNLTTFIQTIINVLLFVIGAVAVIMIIIGGIRYVVSGGDQAAVTGAKNTILYSVIGLVVALLAYAIVNFVLDNLAKTTVTEETTWNTSSVVVGLK
mgnify:CR=1 FL=1